MKKNLLLLIFALCKMNATFDQFGQQVTGSNLEYQIPKSYFINNLTGNELDFSNGLLKMHDGSEYKIETENLPKENNQASALIPSANGQNFIKIAKIILGDQESFSASLIGDLCTVIIKELSEIGLTEDFISHLENSRDKAEELIKQMIEKLEEAGKYNSESFLKNIDILCGDYLMENAVMPDLIILSEIEKYFYRIITFINRIDTPTLGGCERYKKYQPLKDILSNLKNKIEFLQFELIFQEGISGKIKKVSSNGIFFVFNNTEGHRSKADRSTEGVNSEIKGSEFSGEYLIDEAFSICKGYLETNPNKRGYCTKKINYEILSGVSIMKDGSKKKYFNVKFKDSN